MDWNLREAFSGNRGKILIAGGLGLAVYLWWTRGRHVGDGGETPDEGTIVGEPTDRTRQPNPGPQSDPTVGNDTQGGATRPETAEEWISRSVSTLSNPPYNMSATAVYNALRKAIDGSPITTSEASIVEAAIRAWGTPPGGMPPLNTAAPATGGQANGTGTDVGTNTGAKAPRRYMIDSRGRRTWLDPNLPGWYSGDTQRLTYRAGWKAPRRYRITAGKRHWFDPALPGWYSGDTQQI